MFFFSSVVRYDQSLILEGIVFVLLITVEYHFDRHYRVVQNYKLVLQELFPSQSETNYYHWFGFILSLYSN